MRPKRLVPRGARLETAFVAFVFDEPLLTPALRLRSGAQALIWPSHYAAANDGPNQGHAFRVPYSPRPMERNFARRWRSNSSPEMPSISFKPAAIWSATASIVSSGARCAPPTGSRTMPSITLS